MSRHNKGKRRARPTDDRPAGPAAAPAQACARTRGGAAEGALAPVPAGRARACFIGIVCIVVGFFGRDDTAGRTLLALGFALGALGGLDTAVREHFAGFRSHTLVLAAFPAVVVDGR